MRLASTRTFEEGRNLVDTVTHAWDPTGTPVDISVYDYTNDGFGRRTQVTYDGRAFGDPNSPIAQSFGYNDRNELTGSTWDADPNNLVWSYAYDPIGNRETSQNPDHPALAYVANELNQYEGVAVASAAADGGLRQSYDEDGNLIEQVLAGDMNCDGRVDWRDQDLFVAAQNDNCPAYYTLLEQQCPGCDCDCMNGDLNGDGHIDWRDIDWFVSAQNTRGGARYTWNAENRLIAVEPISHLGGVPRVEFAYDYQGRRVAKRVYDWDPGDPNDPNDDDWASTPSVSQAFVWSGWLMLLELDVDPNDANDPSTRRAYTWGLDLAGQQGSTNSLEAAGGVGGLLAVDQAETGGGAGAGGVDAGQ